MEVRLEELKAALDVLSAINKVPLEEIVWTAGGEPLEVDPEAVQRFKFMGLNNTTFAKMYLTNHEGSFHGI